MDGRWRERSWCIDKRVGGEGGMWRGYVGVVAWSPSAAAECSSTCSSSCGSSTNSKTNSSSSRRNVDGSSAAVGREAVKVGMEAGGRGGWELDDMREDQRMVTRGFATRPGRAVLPQAAAFGKVSCNSLLFLFHSLICHTRSGIGPMPQAVMKNSEV